MAIARIALVLVVFAIEVVAVRERAWPSAALFGTTLVSLVFPRSLLPTWTRRSWVALGTLSFLLAVALLPDSFIK